MTIDQNPTLNRKPKGQRKTQDPCPKCFLHKDRCICQFIPNLIYKTKLTLIVHAKELKRTTNTGTLACHSLTNSEIHIRGLKQNPLLGTQIIDPLYQPLLFFPSDTSEDLSTEFLAQFHKPIQLIVPDGNWRQASKVSTRYPELSHVPRVMITAPNLSKVHLRAESTPEGMATLQAIAEAFGILEGEDAKNSLLEIYSKKLQATLNGRSKN